MLTRSLLAATLLTGLAHAVPPPDVVRTTSPPSVATSKASLAVSTGNAPRASADPNRVPMKPIHNPNIDRQDLGNLRGSDNARMQYDPGNAEDKDAYAFVDAEGAANPIVMIEDSDRANITCTENKATVKFSDDEAFDTASDDWGSVPKLAIITNDDSCQASSDTGDRGFILAENFQMNKQSKEITGDIEYVNGLEAFGKGTKMTVNFNGLVANRPNEEPDFHPTAQAPVQTPAPSTTPRPAAKKQKRFLDDVGDWFEDTVSDAGEWIDDTVSEVQDAAVLDGAETGTIDWAAEVTETPNSGVWGSGFNIFPALLPDGVEDLANGTRLDCTECNTNGSIVLSGSFKWRVLELDNLDEMLDEAKFDMTGSMGATLQLGLDGKIGKRIELFNRTLLSTGIPGFSIPNLFSIGPEIGVDVSAGIDIRTEGTMVIGASVNWPNIKVSADAKAGTASGEGLEPDWVPYADMNGSTSVAMDLGFPVYLAFGLSILGFDKQLKLVNTVGLKLGANFSDQEPCVGTDIFLDGYDAIGIDVFDFVGIPITSFPVDLWNTCFPSETSAPVTSSTQPPESDATVTDGTAFPSLVPTGTDGIGMGGASGSGTGTGGTGYYPTATGVAA